MRSINIHQAKTHLSRLIEEAVRGEPFIIAKAGKPLVTVARIDDSAAPAKSRLGFAAGRFKVPADFDTMASEEIRRLFEGEPG
jgi:prevent-host-death family protein